MPFVPTLSVVTPAVYLAALLAAVIIIGLALWACAVCCGPRYWCCFCEMPYSPQPWCRDCSSPLSCCACPGPYGYGYGGGGSDCYNTMGGYYNNNNNNNCRPRNCARPLPPLPDPCACPRYAAIPDSALWRGTIRGDIDGDGNGGGGCNGCNKWPQTNVPSIYEDEAVAIGNRCANCFQIPCVCGWEQPLFAQS